VQHWQAAPVSMELPDQNQVTIRPPARRPPARPPAWPARPIIACLHGAGAQLGSIVDELLEEIVSGLGMDDAEEILSCHGAH